MGVHRMLAAAATFLFFAGCESNRASLAATDPPQADTLPGNPTLAVPRLQKPDNPNPTIRQTTFEAVNSSFPGVPNSRVAVQIRAHVNGVPILDDEVRNACYQFLIPTLSLSEPERSIRQNEIFQRELQQIIDREVVLQDAFAKLSKNGPQYLDKLKQAASKEFDKKLRMFKKTFNCKTDEDLKEMLRSQGQTLEGIRRQVERNFMFGEYMRGRIFPTIDRIGRQQIIEYFQDHTSEFQVDDSVDWQDIFIDANKYPSRDSARRFAEQILIRARNGEEFVKLAKFDNGSSSYQNAEGLGHKRGEINPAEAEPILFQMHDGELGPLVELATGFHIVRLVKRVYAGQLSLDEKTQTEIRRKLQAETFDREAKKLIEELRSKASIEIASNTPTEYQPAAR
jgi:parvulin-like peptidyl-prolyl isomerase